MPARPSCTNNKVKKVMKEFKQRSLKSAGKTIVKDKGQALAIALASAKKKCH